MCLLPSCLLCTTLCQSRHKGGQLLTVAVSGWSLFSRSKGQAHRVCFIMQCYSLSIELLSSNTEYVFVQKTMSPICYSFRRTFKLKCSAGSYIVPEVEAGSQSNKSAILFTTEGIYFLFILIRSTLLLYLYNTVQQNRNNH